jgi:hypothetical protein
VIRMRNDVIGDSRPNRGAGFTETECSLVNALHL